MRTFIRTLFICLCLLTAFRSATAQSIPNNGFENWTTDTFGIAAPDDWGTSDQFWAVFGVSTDGIGQSADRQAGSFSVRLQADTLQNESLPGFILTAFPYNARPAAITGYYKETLRPADAALVQVLFSKYDAQADISDSIGGAYYFLQKTGGSSFTKFSIPIEFKSNDPNDLPDSVTINIFVSSADTTQPSGYVLIDELAFEGSAGIYENTVFSDLKLFPNPAHNMLNLSFSQKSHAPVQAELLDITGRRVQTLYQGRLPEGEQHLRLPLQGIAPGSYFCRLQSGSSSATLKLMITE